MVTPLIRKSLEKQGYKLIGSHSGVKLCRWTKVTTAHLYFESFENCCLHICSQCCEVEVDATSILSTELKAIVVWKQRQVLLVQTNVFFVGGKFPSIHIFLVYYAVIQHLFQTSF